MNLAQLLAAILTDGIDVEIKVSIRRNQDSDTVLSKCEYCDWSRLYSDKETAGRGLRAHHQHCTGYAEHYKWIADMQSGTSSED